MRRWRTRAVASIALLLGASCGKRPAPSGPPPPSAEPELRIGLSSGAAYASLGGPESGELFISELATGVAVGAIPAGARRGGRRPPLDPPPRRARRGAAAPR